LFPRKCTYAKLWFTQYGPHEALGSLQIDVASSPAKLTCVRYCLGPLVWSPYNLLQSVGRFHEAVWRLQLINTVAPIRG